MTGWLTMRWIGEGAGRRRSVRPAMSPCRTRARVTAAAAMVSAVLPTLASYGCGGGAEDGIAYRRLAAGDPAPAYAATTLAGDTLSLEELRGEVVMLNIWATWCLPCRQEMPGLQALHEAYAAEGLRVLGVSIDAGSATAAVRSFLDDFGITFTILHDPAERVTRAFRTMGVPETFLIGRDGRIAMRWIGRFDPEAEGTVAAVQNALGG